MTVGDRIRKQRELLEISQTELAEKVKISKQTLYKYEKNIITNIPSDKIEELANVLHVSESYLMGWDDNLNDEQKKIFAKNLNKYISLNQKQQVDVARDLDINPTTLNMWCNGNSMPNVGKIQKLADYFRIGKSDLTDEKEDVDADMEFLDRVMKIALNDQRFAKIVIGYGKLPTDKKDLICDFFEKFIL